MAKDKFSAVWVSHSSIGDYLKCPRAYFLKNVYKDPRTRHKIAVMSPALALGQAVHETVESLSILPVEDRLSQPLLGKFNLAWEKVTGRKGGFKDETQEREMKSRGEAMLSRIEANPGPILKKAIKIREGLPYFWISEEDNIILCGKIDWMEYLEESDSVHIIDFKTGKYDEDPDSLQLPIYYLLATNCQTRPIAKASYWYIDRDNDSKEIKLPDLVESKNKVLSLAKKIALARKLKHFQCPQEGGCRACQPLEAVIAGKAEFVGINDFNADVYIIPTPTSDIL